MGVPPALNLIRVGFEVLQPLLISLLTGLCRADGCVLEMVPQCLQHHLNPAGPGLPGSSLQGTLQRLRQFQLQDSQMPPRMRVSHKSCRS